VVVEGERLCSREKLRINQDAINRMRRAWRGETREGELGLHQSSKLDGELALGWEGVKCIWREERGQPWVGPRGRVASTRRVDLPAR
jgi:hypothetical protein